jgi:hypothetical protein
MYLENNRRGLLSVSSNTGPFQEIMVNMAEDETPRPTEEMEIGKFPSTEGFCQGIGRNGELYLRQNIFRPARKGRGYMPQRALVALALTEICCSMRIGKVTPTFCSCVSYVLLTNSVSSQVLYFPMQEELSWKTTKMTRDKESVKASSVRAFYRLPQLIYVPKRRTEEDQEIWTAMAHTGEYNSISTRQFLPTSYRQIMKNKL